MKIPPVKGTRDFYPEQMRLRNWIIDGWKDASIRNGFLEYDGPIFEYLKMYQVKSGDEIVEQLFSFQDRGDRHLAIRPEITPTLARMVNQQINSLPRPIKWFSVPRVCRAERPQKGRLREFFQWNIDIIGVDDIIADAEVVFTSIDYLRQIGLTSDDVVAKISSRKMLAAILEEIGLEEGELIPIYAVLDKKAKLSEEAFAETLEKVLPDAQKREKVNAIMNVKAVDEIESILELSDEAQAAVDELKDLFKLLESMGVGDFCTFDISIVRGLAYYTGVVFEVHDKAGDLRAVCGGGRYDNLLKDFGGPSVPATGMGMGDCVLEILLESKGLLEDVRKPDPIDYYIACLDKELLGTTFELAARLRSKGYRTEFTYKAAKLGKLMKQASALNAKKCVILGGEYLEDRKLSVKDMATGDQEQMTCDELIEG